jgi:hypothetical protein
VGTPLTNHTTDVGGYYWLAPKTSSKNLILSSTNSALATNTAVAIQYVNHTISSADYTAIVDVQTNGTTSGQEFSLAVRFDGATDGSLNVSNAYFINWRWGTYMRVYKIVATVSTALADVTEIKSVTNFSFQVSGTTLTVKTNSAVMWTGTDSSLSAAGFVGIGDMRGNDPQGYFYKNLRVTVP